MLDKENSWPPEPTAPVVAEPAPKRALPIFIKVGAVLNLPAVMATAPAYIKKFTVYYDSEWNGIPGWIFGFTVAVCVIVIMGAVVMAIRRSDKRAWLGVALCLLPIAVTYGMLALAPNPDTCGCGG